MAQSGVLGVYMALSLEMKIAGLKDPDPSF